MMRAVLAVCLVGPICGTSVRGAELKPATVAAFDRYVQLTEARIDAELKDDGRFIHVDSLPEPQRRARLKALTAGELVIERLGTRENGREIDVPDGLIHHWLGVGFIPGRTATDALSLLRDYDRHDEIFRPAVQQARVLEHSAGRYRVFLRFFMEKVIAVTLNTEHDARFTVVSPQRAYSRIVSTRIQEVGDAGKPTERELPVGNDGGYLWRINSYWRFLERDGGVYVQCESVSLSRGIPFGLGWIVGPFVTSIPRESLTFTLETTRRVLAEGRS